MGDVTIYHNPRCSKSRQTLDLLRERGVDPTIVEYLKDPPSKETLTTILDQLGGAPHDLLRTKEPAYAELGLSKDSDAATVADAIAAHPVLMERPVVVRDEKAALGRPPENVLKLWDAGS